MSPQISFDLNLYFINPFNFTEGMQGNMYIFFRIKLALSLHLVCKCMDVFSYRDYLDVIYMPCELQIRRGRQHLYCSVYDLFPFYFLSLTPSKIFLNLSEI